MVTHTHTRQLYKNLNFPSVFEFVFFIFHSCGGLEIGMIFLSGGANNGLQFVEDSFKKRHKDPVMCLPSQFPPPPPIPHLNL